MRKKKIRKQYARSRFAGLSLSLAVLGMMGLLLAFADRTEPVVWVAFGFGFLGVIGINVVYSSIIYRLGKAAKVKKKLKRVSPDKLKKHKQKEAAKAGKIKGVEGRNELRNLDKPTL